MPFVLEKWLHNPPQNTVWFSRIIIILSLIYQASSGVMSAIQSTGQIKWYTIIISATILFTLPLAYFALKKGCIPEIALIIACATETIALFIRLIFAKKLITFPIREYLNKAVIPTTILFIFTGIMLSCVHYFIPSSYLRLLIICSADIIIISLLSYILLLDCSEKQAIKSLYSKILKYKK